MSTPIPNPLWLSFLSNLIFPAIIVGAVVTRDTSLVNLTLFLCGLCAFAGLGAFVSKEVSPPSRLPKWFRFLCVVVPVFTLASAGWFWCAAAIAFCFVSIAAANDRVRKKEGA